MSKWYNSPKRVDDWYNKYSMLVEYYNIYGCMPKSTEIFLGYGLGRWLYTQKSRNKKGELPQVFINLINNIDSTWAM